MTCPRCRERPSRPSHAYCGPCKNAYSREWRKTHRLNDEQRRRLNARAYARVYQERGHLTPQPCEVCGSTQVERHHEDYSQPLKVRWLCREDHLALHKRERLL